jgi:hypothetical protein
MQLQMLNRTSIILTVITISLLLTASLAGAQSEEALGLTLLKTSMRTQNDSVTLITQIFQDVFQPSSGTCPASAVKGCTLKIDVSCIFQDNYFGNSETIQVSVSGPSLPTVDPAQAVPVDGVAASSPNWDARHFTWMQRNIPAGATVTVNIGVAGSGSVLYRTETLTLFQN